MRSLSESVEMLLVIGAANSSNSNRLRDLGAEMGVPSHLIDDARGIQPHWLEGIRTVGITAGASAPDMASCRRERTNVSA